ncbi:MAG: lipopolysaccharide biosynthesis protein [Bacteroides sp.]
MLINNSKFIRNTVVLTFGTALAQVIPMIIYPILGRMYEPIDFAILASMTSFVSILCAIFSGKYENAIFLAKDDNEAASLFTLSILLTVAFVSITILPLILFEDYCSHFLGVTELDNWIYISLLLSVSICIYNSYNEWCVRKEYFARLSANKIINSIAISLGKLFWGFRHVCDSGLVKGDLLGRIISALLCVFRLLYIDYAAFKEVRLSNLKIVAIKYKDFPMFNMPAQLLNTIGVSFPIFIMNSYYSSNEVGYYAMTMSILNLPINVISLSIRDVFRKIANDIYAKELKFNVFFVKVLLLLGIFSIVVGALCLPFLPFLFEFVLGGKWTESGIYAQYLTPMIILDFIAMSLSGSLLVAKKLKRNFVWQIYYVFSTIIPLWIAGVLKLDIYTALAMYSIGRCTAYVYLLLISYKSSLIRK